MAIEFEGATCKCGHPKDFHKDHDKVHCVLCYALSDKGNYSCSGFDPLACAECGATDVRSRDERQPFKYRDGEELVDLNCVYPIRRCAACNFEFSDWEAEQMKGRSVAFYLLHKMLKDQERAKKA